MNDDNSQNDPNKFAEFNRMIVRANSEGVKNVLIALPEALGDNYHELVMNLNKLAEAGLSLTIVPPSQRHRNNN